MALDYFFSEILQCVETSSPSSISLDLAWWLGGYGGGGGGGVGSDGMDTIVGDDKAEWGTGPQEEGW